MIEHYGDIIELDYKLKPDAIDHAKQLNSGVAGRKDDAILI